MKNANQYPLMARYPTQDHMVTRDARNQCEWFYGNTMKLEAERNNQKIKIRKIRGGNHYTEVTS